VAVPDAAWPKSEGLAARAKANRHMKRPLLICVNDLLKL
jgi:hypothetical protein